MAIFFSNEIAAGAVFPDLLVLLGGGFARKIRVN
jgi:hypothetical protein